MKKKVCKKCKLFVEEEECPICGGRDFGNSWQGRVTIIDVNKSLVAKKAGITTKGEYAIKTR